MDETVISGMLRTLGHTPDDAIDLAEGALALSAAAQPRLDLAPYRRHLAELGRDLDAAAAARGDDVRGRVAALTEVMVGRHRYTGESEDYEALDNADIARVIDRRRGLPVALSIVWIHTARCLGWRVGGVNFPGHFLIRLDHAGERAILDPFHDGRGLGPSDLKDLLRRVQGEDAALAPEHTAPVGNRAILLRLQNNIKLRLLKAERFADAAAVIERMVMIAPEEPALWHEAGQINARLGNMLTALRCLDAARGHAGDPAARAQIEAELRAIRTRLN